MVCRQCNAYGPKATAVPIETVVERAVQLWNVRAVSANTTDATNAAYTIPLYWTMQRLRGEYACRLNGVIVASLCYCDMYGERCAPEYRTMITPGFRHRLTGDDLEQHKSLVEEHVRRELVDIIQPSVTAMIMMGWRPPMERTP